MERKKLLTIVLVIALAVMLCPTTVLASVGDTFINDGFQYKVLTETETTGTVEVIANSYSGSITIPEMVENGGITYTVTSIGDYAFASCSSLTSISIPDNVTSIGDFAFTACSGLPSLSIPNSVTSIGEGAFGACTSLTSINLPDNVTSAIGNWAFSGCTNLTSISIPDGVSAIGNWAFGFCTSLTTINLPDSVTAIGNWAFSDCINLTSINIPDIGLTSIGECAFYNCSGLTSINIPDSVTSILNMAFYNCSGLTSIIIPDSMTSIEGGVFAYCSGLTSISIPNSVTFIGTGAFAICSSLTSINIPDNVTSIGDGVFGFCSNLTNIGIPGSVTSIGVNAFSECSSLTSISIPDSVTFIGDYTFSGCSGLTSIVFFGGTPLSFGSNVFLNVPEGLLVIVPAGTASGYGAVLDGKLPANSYIIEVVSLAAIQGVTPPVRGETPVSAISETGQYTGTVTWAPAHNPFAASTVYTATITLTPKAGYALNGVAENFFTAAGVTSVSNTANSGVITAVFPATGAAKGTITGTVTDGKNPISGADVNMAVSGSVYSATTIADGSYNITNVPAGTGYTVTASKSGYTSASAADVSVTANTTTSGVNITLTSDQDGCLLTYRGAQKRYNADTNTYDIRFIATIDTLNAKEVGFVFSKSVSTPTKENATVKATTTVYRSITAEGVTVTAVNLGGVYIVAYTITGIPISDIDVPLYVSAFSTVGTETKYTTAVEVTVNNLP